MGDSRVLVLLAFALCVVACMSASGAEGIEVQPPEITEETAQKAVELANNTIMKVCDKAKSKINDAKALLLRVELAKQKAEKEKTEAEKAPQDNTKAQKIVESIKTIYTEVNALFEDAKDKLGKAISSMEGYQQEAETLKTQCDAQVVASDSTTEAYTAINTTASALREKADELDTNINNALSEISGVDAKAAKMEEDATNAQVKNIHIHGVVAVAQIQTIIREADGIITNTNNEKDKVHGIVEGMKKHCTAELMQSNEVIKQQCQSATDALKSATDAVAKAQNAMAAMKQQKGLADTALENVLKTTAVSAADNAMTNIQECVRKVNQMEEEAKSALGTAQNIFAKAEDSKQNLQTAMSKNTSKPGTGKDTKTEKTDLSVGQEREPDQKDTTIQPTSKDSPDQSNNSAEEIKQTLINGVQNVPTTALTGGKARALGAKNDSAMTVSVPLLVALIASAVLQ